MFELLKDRDTTSTNVAYFLKPTYKVQVQIGIYSHLLYPHVYLPSLGTGHNIAYKIFLWEEWSMRTKDHSISELRPAKKTLVRLLETILHLIRISDSQNKVSLELVKVLAVYVLFKHSMYGAVHSREFLWEKKKNYHDAWNRYRFSQNSSTKVNKPRRTSNLQTLSPHHYKTVVRIAKEIILQSYIQTRVNAATSTSGLSSIEPALLNQRYSHIHVATERTETSNDRTFWSLVCNFGVTVYLIPTRGVVLYAWQISQ